MKTAVANERQELIAQMTWIRRYEDTYEDFDTFSTVRQEIQKRMKETSK